MFNLNIADHNRRIRKQNIITGPKVSIAAEVKIHGLPVVIGFRDPLPSDPFSSVSKKYTTETEVLFNDGQYMSIPD